MQRQEVFFGDGEAYFWDVSDPENLKIIDTVKVDARNVNDVKVSEDGKIGVITREGASNRKNGLFCSTSQTHTM